MQWIKRNLFFTIGGVVALALMVLAVFYVMQSMKDSSDVQEEINGQIAELQRLYEKDPFPSDENVAAAKQEQQKVKDLIADAKTFFAPFPAFASTDNHGFQELLGTTIFSLQKQATAIGVTLPPQYAFTFSGQRNALQLSPASIDPWLSQLSEIRAICGVLYQAKINELYGIRRVALTEDDKRQANTVDYLVGYNVITNKDQTTVFAPYEITFRGFSTEVANVLSGFLQASNCFIVKAVSVEPAPFTPQAAAAVGYPLNTRVPVPVPVPVPSAAPEGYGKGGGLPIPPPTPIPAPAPRTVAGRPAAPVSVTVLSERPLRVTMLVETVKLKERK